jgi:hypothetical protein
MRQRTPAIAKTLDASQLQGLGKATDQARDDASSLGVR